MYTATAIKSELPYYQEILLFYKMNQCYQNHQRPIGDFFPINFNSGLQTCFNYHGPEERRRPLFEEENLNSLYQPVKCPSLLETGECLNGDLCRYAHTQNEVNYHPLFYKTEPCSGCVYEKNTRFCPYFHPDELNRKVTIEKLHMKVNKGQFKGKGTSEPDQDNFNLDSFKANSCPHKGSHNPKVCIYYHHDKDKKRPVGIFHYSSEMCYNVKKNRSCPNGDNCGFCHNKVEQLYHPERYKKKFCLCCPHTVHKCEYGNYCSFAHSEDEIKIELLHNLKEDEDFYLYKYKTVFCPYIYDHGRIQCVYAHNPQDFRRDPKIYNYNANQCKFWSQKQIFSYEEGGCSKQMNCENCHGWKELEYHTSFYKTKPCNNGSKCTKKYCPFYHSNAEKRTGKPSSQLTQTLLGDRDPANFAPYQQKTREEPVANPILSFEATKPSSYSEKNESSSIKSKASTLPASRKESTQDAPSLEPKPFFEISTRPNSNISSKNFLEEDSSQKKSQKMKSKKTFLNKKEGVDDHFFNQIYNDKDRTTKHVNSGESDTWDQSKQHEAKETFEEFFKPFEAKRFHHRIEPQETFDLPPPSNFVDRHLATTTTANRILERTNSQFLKNLFLKLEKKGLERIINDLVKSNIDPKTLRSLSPHTFHIFPKISLQDKEELAKAIQDVLEEEALLSEINTLQEPLLTEVLNQNTSEGLDVFGNLETYNSRTHFK